MPQPCQRSFKQVAIGFQACVAPRAVGCLARLPLPYSETMVMTLVPPLGAEL